MQVQPRAPAHAAGGGAVPGGAHHLQPGPGGRVPAEGVHPQRRHQHPPAQPRAARQVFRTLYLLQILPRPLHRDTPRRRWWGCGPRPAHLTRLTLVSCQLGGGGVRGGGGARGGAELYLTVKCEGETHRSGRVSSSGDTVVWDFSLVLYRSQSLVSTLTANVVCWQVQARGRYPGAGVGLQHPQGPVPGPVHHHRQPGQPLRRRHHQVTLSVCFAW